MTASLSRRLVAECLGTAFLVAAVVGSGIMGERLANGNMALALLANTIATGTVLVVLIQVFGPISGAHLNPVVSLSDAATGGLPWREVVAYIFAQVLGGVGGAVTAHVMFGLSPISLSHHIRTGPAQVLSEFVATLGLVLVIRGCSRFRPSAVPIAVGCYITSSYWFTASTSFANPAVTIARSLSDTFSGIRPLDVPLFVFGQLTGAYVAILLFRWLVRAEFNQARKGEPLSEKALCSFSRMSGRSRSST